MEEVKNVALGQCPFQKLPSHVVKFLNLSMPGFFCLFTATSTAMLSRYPPDWTPGRNVPGLLRFPKQAELKRSRCISGGKKQQCLGLSSPSAPDYASLLLLMTSPWEGGSWRQVLLLIPLCPPDLNTGLAHRRPQ